MLKRELQIPPDLEEYFYIDTEIVVGYILLDSHHFHLLVGNRVSYIESFSSDLVVIRLLC